MGLIARLAAALRAPDAGGVNLPQASADGGRPIVTTRDLEIAIRAGRETGSGALVSPDNSLRVAAVYGCVRIIAGAVATMPLHLKRRIDDRNRRDASDHPLWNVLRRRPNAWMTPSAFRRMMTAHVLLRGNAYALIVRGTGGRVLELLPMHPDRVTIEQLDDLTLVYTCRRKNGGMLVLPQADVFHLTGLTLDGYTGLSVIGFAREAVGLALQTERHGASVFKNGAAPSLHFSHPERLSPEALAHLRESLAEYRGSENAAKTLITEEGIKVEQIAMTSEDAQYIETRAFTRGEIAMFFGVPPHMLGDTDKATSWGSGIEQQSLGFVAYTLQDWLTAWEETIVRDLIGPNDDAIYARFNPAGLVRGDMKTRWQAYVQGLQWGVFSPNEIRELEDRNPREGGDIYYPPPNTAGVAGSEPDPDPENLP